MKNVFNIIGLEVKRIFKSKLLTATLIAVVCLPLIYGALYLWAFWDPYNRTEDIKVAVVNNDQGSNVLKDKNLGNLLVNKLKNNQTFDWQFVSEEKALNKMNNREYYAAIIIEKDFTNKALSGSTANTQQAAIVLKTREANNFIFAKMASSAGTKIVADLNQIISTEFIKTYNQEIITKNTALAIELQKLSKSVCLDQTSSQCLTVKALLNTLSNPDSQEKVKNIDSNAGILARPIVLEEQPIDKVENYGTGFTPYFLPLSLWVGALSLFFLINPFKKETSKKEYKSWEIVTAKLSISFFVGFLQSITLNIVLIGVLGLNVEHVLAYFLISFLISWVFIAIHFFIIGLLDQVGRFLSIILLMLQLTSGAGTYPIETTPKFLQILHPFLPMKYAIVGLREIISGTVGNVLANQFLMLFGYLILFLVLIYLTGWKKFKASKLKQANN